MTGNWTRVVLAGGWVTLMLIYLLGDVLRIFAGHLEPGKLGGKPAPGWMWTLAAVIMLVPIAMILISLLTPEPPLRLITIGVSAALAIFNLAGLPYKGFYDNLLIAVSLSVNALIIWLAWTWETAETLPE
jgi:hypothetical protein